MFLYLTNSNPGRAKFITESGQVLYKSETPFKLSGKSTVVTKVVPNDAPEPPGAHPHEAPSQEDGEGEDSDVDSEDILVEEVEPNMQDRYQYMGSIKWKPLSRATFVVPGEEEIAAKDFFTTGSGLRYVFRVIRE